MKNHFWTPAKRHTSRGYPGQQHMTKKNHQIALKVSKNWPSFWLCPRKFQRNYLGLGSLVGLGSFAVRPGSCPFFRQIKRKGITLSFNWGWSFTNSGLGLDSGSQILLCRGPRLYKLISVPQPGTLGQGWSRVWHLVSRLLGIETFLNFLRVSVSVSKILVSKKSLGIGLENI